MGMSGQIHPLAALFSGKEPVVPIAGCVGLASEPVWTLRRRYIINLLTLRGLQKRLFGRLDRSVVCKPYRTVARFLHSAAF
jgi:hypothetical protein